MQGETDGWWWGVFISNIIFDKNEIMVSLLSDRHDLIKKMYALKDTNSDLAVLLLEQVLEELLFPLMGSSLAHNLVLPPVSVYSNKPS